MIDLAKIKQNNPIEGVASKLGLVLKGYTGNTKAAKCFNHDDKHASLVFFPTINRYECKACGTKGDVIDLVMAIKGLDFKEAIKWLEPETEFSTKKPQTPAEYLKARGITEATQKKFKLRVENNRLVIPIPTGEKYRLFGGVERFAQKHGTTACIFKTSKAKNKAIILVEGEIDAIVLSQATGYPVWSASCGAATFPKKWLSDFSGLERIYIGYDNDKGGRGGAKKVAGILGKERCFKIEVPKHIGKDWSDYFSLGFSKADFDELLKQATPFLPKPISIRERLANKKEDQEKFKSGFERIDKVVNGFRSGGVYLVAGLEKSGKSSFLMNIADHFLQEGKKVAYLNTELTDRTFFSRMSALWTGQTFQEVEDNPTAIGDWARSFEKNFSYAGLGDLVEEEVISFDKLLETAEQFVKKGAKVFFIDNLTTFNISLVNYKRGWEVLASSLMKMINFAKINNVLVFVVIHTKQNIVFNETPVGVRNMIEAGEPERIFQESITVIKKPTLMDVFGGGSALSQLSGSILIWRPFQKFNNSKFKKMGAVILDSFRHAESGVDISVDFDGSRGRFKEQSEDLEKIAEKIFNK